MHGQGETLGKILSGQPVNLHAVVLRREQDNKKKGKQELNRTGNFFPIQQRAMSIPALIKLPC
jgi:hypothetical protein